MTEIDTNKLYPKRKLQKDANIGEAAWRTMLRADPPLKILRVNGRTWVKGSDFLAYLESHSE